MSTPKVERLPPVTIEFLRYVYGVETVRLRCESCKTVRIASWAEIGLPDDTPFPPDHMVWQCGVCGGVDVTATPEQPLTPKPERKATAEIASPPSDTKDAAYENDGITDSLRESLESIMSYLGQREA